MSAPRGGDQARGGVGSETIDSERRVWVRKRDDRGYRPMSRATRPSRTATSSASSSAARLSRSASSQESARSRVRVPRRRAGERHRVGPRPAARTDEPARGHVEGRVGERGGPAAGHAAVDPRAMAEQIHRPQPEADRDPRGTAGHLQRGERPDQQGEERRMRITVGGQARHHLHRPRAPARGAPGFPALGRRGARCRSGPPGPARCARCRRTPSRRA